MLNLFMLLLFLLIMGCLLGFVILLISIAIASFKDQEYWQCFGATLFATIISLLILIGCTMVVTVNGDGVPYDVKYEKRCLLMEGEHTTERKWSAATKTTRTYHYCTINGNKFSDIGVK